MTNKTAVCPICKASFEQLPGKGKTRDFCSKECLEEHKRAYYREYRKSHPEQRRRYAERNKERLRAASQRWRTKVGPEGRWARRLERVYGLTLDQFVELERMQGGMCALCGGPPVGGQGRSKKKPNLAVDHDHVTGKIRGLLCLLCNTMLGNAKDDPALLRKAAIYLEERR